MIIAARTAASDPVILLEGSAPEFNNKYAAGVPDLFRTHNQTINTPSTFVMARSSLRSHCYLMCKYGRPTSDSRRVLVLFTRHSKDPTRCFFSDLLLDDILYKHIQRQMFLAEEAMFEAANAIARLTRGDLVAAGVIPADNSFLTKIHDSAPSKARVQLFSAWWARHGRSTELVTAMNQLLAPFNLVLYKDTTDRMSHVYDHYILRPSELPWSPPSPTLPHGLRDHYERELQTLRASLEPRRHELSKMWIKSHKQWEREIVPKQATWLDATNKQLVTHQVQAFFSTTVSPYEEACWDLRYAAIVDKNALMYRNAVSDRTYLSNPFREILPSIVTPPQYVHPGGAPPVYVPSTGSAPAPGTVPQATPIGSAPMYAHAPLPGQQTYYAPPVQPAPLAPLAQVSWQQKQEPVMATAASAKIRMAITVPAGRRPGELIQFLSPSGKVNQVQIPANVAPGMQFLVNAEA